MNVNQSINNTTHIVEWRSATRNAPQCCSDHSNIDLNDLKTSNTSHDYPSPRSDHAMTYLNPINSFLLFGGLHEDTILGDFYLLEPNVSKYSSTFISQPTSLSIHNTKQFQWRKLESIISHEFQNSQILGRRNHTMHYIQSSELQDEKEQGMHVIIVGNTQVFYEEAMTCKYDIEIYLRIDHIYIDHLNKKVRWMWQSEPQFSDKTLTFCPDGWRPAPRLSHASVLVENRLYVFGGLHCPSNKDTYLNELCVYDTTLNQWTLLRSTGQPPSPRAYSAMTHGNNKLFVFGGYDGNHHLGGLFVYNIEENCWSQCMKHNPNDTITNPSTLSPSNAEFHLSRRDHSLSFLQPNHLLVYGGRQQYRRPIGLFIFDLVTMSWQILSKENTKSYTGDKLTTWPTGRCNHTASIYPTQANNILTNNSKNLSNFKHGKTHQILIFGGYSGKHTWLSDTIMLEIVLNTKQHQFLQPKPRNMTMDPLTFFNIGYLSIISRTTGMTDVEYSGTTPNGVTSAVNDNNIYQILPAERELANIPTNTSRRVRTDEFTDDLGEGYMILQRPNCQFDHTDAKTPNKRKRENTASIGQEQVQQNDETAQTSAILNTKLPRRLSITDDEQRKNNIAVVQSYQEKRLDTIIKKLESLENRVNETNSNYKTLEKLLREVISQNNKMSRDFQQHITSSYQRMSFISEQVGSLITETIAGGIKEGILTPPYPSLSEESSNNNAS